MKLFLILLIFSSYSAAEKLGFNSHIRPILSDKCFACHGPDPKSIKGKLQLHKRDLALKAIEPGHPEKSELIARINTDDEDDLMPPEETHKKLTSKERKLLARWIKEGAEYEDHWSFISLKKTPVPPVPGKVKPANAIDNFIIRKAVAAGYDISPLADRRTLIRRVTLNLTGMLPEPAEVENFVNDKAGDDAAFEKVVDRLLNSPKYGEHMAYSWLDLARYADSDGYESDPMRDMWPWRDWVIHSFNSNMSYDQFITYQLAGDLVKKPSMESRLATAFNRNHRVNNEGGVLPEEWLVEYICDRAETTATAFLGLTWSCSRCHDHKYDPITAKDYYSLFAFFHNVDETIIGRGDSVKPRLKVPAMNKLAAYEKFQSEITPLQKEFEGYKKKNKHEKEYKEWLKTADLKKLKFSAKDIKQKASLKGRIYEHYYLKIDPAVKKKFASYFKMKKKGETEFRESAWVRIMEEMPKPRKSHVLKRGLYDQKGEEVTMNTPHFLPPMKKGMPKNRLGLAQWLVDKDNPLTARVAVNRFWERYFGRGLVKTQEDFGSQGQLPTHPQLLDFLAGYFMDSGWDVKNLQKFIVMSRTYRQSSTIKADDLVKDPQNVFLARGPRYRLHAAVIRDIALQGSGLLVQKMGGRAVKPYHPPGLWEDVLKGKPVYKKDSGENLYRRSIYTLWRRGVKPPLMELLDANNRDVCKVNHSRTSSPLQALLMLNDITFVEAARVMAQRLLKSKYSQDTQRISLGMNLMLSRAPDSHELKAMSEALGKFKKYYTADAKAAEKLINIGESKTDKSLNKAELAAYTALCRIILNHPDNIMKF